MDILGFILAVLLSVIVSIYAVVAVFGCIALKGKCPTLVLVLALAIPLSAWYLTITNTPFTIVVRQGG